MADYYVRYDSFSLSHREEERTIHISFTVLDHDLSVETQEVVSLPEAVDISGFSGTLAELRDMVFQRINSRAQQWILRRAKLEQLYTAAQAYVGTEVQVTGL